MWLDPNKTGPFEFYQYWRNIGDQDVMKCIRMLTFLPVEEINEMEKWDDNRINEKKEILAYDLTALVHGEEEALKAKTASKALFEGGTDDSNMPTTELEDSVFENGEIFVLDLLIHCGLIKSKSEGRRLIEQNGITIQDKKVEDPSLIMKKDDFKEGIRIRKGKKIFHKAIIS